MLRKYLLFVTFLLATIAHAETRSIWNWTPTDPNYQPTNEGKTFLADASGNRYVLVFASHNNYLVKFDAAGLILWRTWFRNPPEDLRWDPLGRILLRYIDPSTGQPILARIATDTGSIGARLFYPPGAKSYICTGPDEILWYSDHPVLDAMLTRSSFATGYITSWCISNSEQQWDYWFSVFVDDQLMYRWRVDRTDNGLAYHIAAYDLNLRRTLWDRTVPFDRNRFNEDSLYSLCIPVGRDLVLLSREQPIRLAAINEDGTLLWDQALPRENILPTGSIVTTRSDSFDFASGVDGGTTLRRVRLSDGQILSEATFSASGTCASTLTHVAFQGVDSIRVFDRQTGSLVINFPEANPGLWRASSFSLDENFLTLSGSHAEDSNFLTSEGLLYRYRLSDGSAVETTHYHLPKASTYGFQVLASLPTGSCLVKMKSQSQYGTTTLLRLIGPRGHAMWEEALSPDTVSTVATTDGSGLILLSLSTSSQIITRAFNAGTGAVVWQDVVASTTPAGAIRANTACQRVVLGYGTLYRVLSLSTGALIRAITSTATLLCQDVLLEDSGNFYALHGGNQVRKYLATHTQAWSRLIGGPNVAQLTCLGLTGDSYLFVACKQGNGGFAVQKIRTSNGTLGSSLTVNDLLVTTMQVVGAGHLAVAGRPVDAVGALKRVYDTTTLAMRWERYDSSTMDIVMKVAFFNGGNTVTILEGSGISARVYSVGTLDGATVPGGFSIEQLSSDIDIYPTVGTIVDPRHVIVTRTTGENEMTQNYLDFVADTTIVSPTGFELVRGELSGGDLDSLVDSDDSRIEVFSDSFFDQVELNLRADGTVPFHINARVRVEAYSARGGVAQVVWIGNSDGTTWTLLGSETASTSDSVREYPVPETVNLNGVNSLRARLAWRPINDDSPSQDGWLVGIDEFQWLLD